MRHLKVKFKFPLLKIATSVKRNDKLYNSYK